MKKKDLDVVAIDARVIRQLKHEMNHMDPGVLVPEAIQNMKFLGTHGKEISILDIIRYHKSKLATVVKYCEMCLDGNALLK